MQKAKHDVNNFATGLVSDASAINTPEGVVLGCTNFELQLSGGARLRPSLQVEDNNRVLISGATSGTVSGYVWEAPAGEEGTQIVLIQVGSSFKVLRRASGAGTAVTDITPTVADSPHGIFTSITGITPVTDGVTHARLSYASTSKYCVITGLAGTIGGADYQELVYILEYDKANQTVHAYADVVWVRDFFGVPDERTGGSRTNTNPPEAAVAYNLFNQGWASEVSGTYPNKYVINSFYNTAAVAQADSVCASQASVNTGVLTQLSINGSSTVGGVYYAPYGASKVTITTSVAPGALSYFAFNVYGTDASGSSISENIVDLLGVTSYTTVNKYATITGVEYITNMTTNFQVGESNLYPGDYDNWSLGVYLSSATAKSFAPALVVQGPDASGRAPKGHFIVPLHYRSAAISTQTMGRALFTSAYNKIFQAAPDSLGDDRSGRPSKVAAYAGRFWYAGTRDLCVNESTTNNSPSIANTIAFSRVVQTIEDCCVCYSRNNPTAVDFNAVLADDGGHIVIQELGEVRSLVPQAGGLLVIASNGVWMITGNNDSGFSATGYMVTKLSETGCVSEMGVVTSGPFVLFPSIEGIEIVAANESGRGLTVKNITDGKIGNTYDSIVDLSTIVGTYDHSNSLARFLYQVNGVYKKEITLHVALGAWAETEYNVTGSSQIVGALQFSGTRSENFSTADVRVPNSAMIILTGTDVQLAYLRYDDADGATFGWEDLDGGSYASLSELKVGHVSFGDLMVNKYSVYLDVYCEKTEDTYTVVSGEATVNHQSSCLVDAYWEWADSATSQYKAQQFEAYRFRRNYMLESADGTYSFNYGQSVVVTHNKLRGHGRTIAIRFVPSAGKDCRPLGWSIGIGAN